MRGLVCRLGSTKLRHHVVNRYMSFKLGMLYVGLRLQPKIFIIQSIKFMQSFQFVFVYYKIVLNKVAGRNTPQILRTL